MRPRVTCSGTSLGTARLPFIQRSMEKGHSGQGGGRPQYILKKGGRGKFAAVSKEPRCRKSLGRRERSHPYHRGGATDLKGGSTSFGRLTFIGGDGEVVLGGKVRGLAEDPKKSDCEVLPTFWGVKT